MTYNATSYDTAKATMLDGHRGDVVLLQEHRLLDAACNNSTRAAHRAGWHAVMPPARRTEAGSTSAGVGVFTKRPIGLVEHADIIPSDYKHRIAAG